MSDDTTHAAETGPETHATDPETHATDQAANAGGVTPSPTDLLTMHTENARAIASTQTQVDAHESVLGKLIDQVETIAQKGLTFAETGALGPAVATGADLVQEIVDFLHRLFPGHNAPGVPTTPPTAI